MILAGLAWSIAGSILAIAVTISIEDVPPWSRRLGRTNLRLANLPVGGTVGMLAAIGLELAGAHSTATLLAGASAAAGLVPPILGGMRPLPTLCPYMWRDPARPDRFVCCSLNEGHFGECL